MKKEWIQDEALNMLNELDYLKYESELVNKEDGGKTRVVRNRNPKWYSVLYRNYWNGRHRKYKRCPIRRPRLVKALLDISEGKDVRTFHGLLAMEEIKSRIDEGYEQDGYYIPPRMEWENS